MTQEATSDRYYCERCGGVLRVQLMGTTVCSSCGTSHAPKFEPKEATSVSEPKLPDELLGLIRAVADMTPCNSWQVQLPVTTLVAAIAAYGTLKYQRGYKDSDSDYYEEASLYD